MNSAFSTRLRMRMAELRLSQSGLARKLGTKQSTVNRWLNGSMPSGALVGHLCAAVNLAHSELFGESEKPQKPTHRGGGDMPRIQAMSPVELGEEIKRLFAAGDIKAPYLVDHVIARLAFAEAEIAKP